jgi:hypothetical protein
VVGRRLRLRCAITDSELDDGANVLMARAAGTLASSGCEVRGVKTELDPSIVIVDDEELFTIQFSVRVQATKSLDRLEEQGRPSTRFMNCLKLRFLCTALAIFIQTRKRIAKLSNCELRKPSAGSFSPLGLKHCGNCPRIQRDVFNTVARIRRVRCKVA